MTAELAQIQLACGHAHLICTSTETSANSVQVVPFLMKASGVAVLTATIAVFVMIKNAQPVQASTKATV